MNTPVAAIADLDAALPQMPPEMRAAYGQWRKGFHAEMGKLSSQGMERKATSGVLPCCAPVGYRNVGKKIEIDPVLAPLVKEAFERAATSRLPLRALLAEMTAKGLVSRTGRPLKVSAFWYILQNPFYTGMIRWHGKLLLGTHEPLVSQELFERLGSKIDTRSQN